MAWCFSSINSVDYTPMHFQLFIGKSIVKSLLQHTHSHGYTYKPWNLKMLPLCQYMTHILYRKWYAKHHLWFLPVEYNYPCWGICVLTFWQLKTTAYGLAVRSFTCYKQQAMMDTSNRRHPLWLKSWKKSNDNERSTLQLWIRCPRVNDTGASIAAGLIVAHPYSCIMPASCAWLSWWLIWHD